MKTLALFLTAFACLLALPASADTLVIANKGEDTVSFVDLASGQERERVPTGRAPHEVAASPDGRQVAVVAYGGASIDIFDVRSSRLVRRIDIAPHDGPHGIAWIGRRRIVVAAERGRSVVLIDPARGVAAAIPTDQRGSHMLAVAPDRTRAYVSNIMSGTVSVIDLVRLTKLNDIKVGGYPEGIAVARDGRQLWVGDDSAPLIRVVDLATQKIVRTIATRSIAIRVLFTRDGKTAVVSNMTTDTLELFDARTGDLRQTISVSGSPNAMQVTIALSRDGRRVYVAETARSTVAEVDIAKGQVTRRIQAGANGDGLAIAP